MKSYFSKIDWVTLPVILFFALAIGVFLIDGLNFIAIKTHLGFMFTLVNLLRDVFEGIAVLWVLIFVGLWICWPIFLIGKWAIKKLS